MQHLNNFAAMHTFNTLRAPLADSIAAVSKGLGQIVQTVFVGAPNEALLPSVHITVLQAVTALLRDDVEECEIEIGKIAEAAEPVQHVRAEISARMPRDEATTLEPRLLWRFQVGKGGLHVYPIPPPILRYQEVSGQIAGQLEHNARVFENLALYMVDTDAAATARAIAAGLEASAHASRMARAYIVENEREGTKHFDALSEAVSKFETLTGKLD